MAEKDNENISREERLNIEEKAIQALLQYGVKFSIPLKINPAPVPKRIQWWNRYFSKHPKSWRDSRIPKDWDVEITEIADVNIGSTREVYMRNFHVKPLYLGTIDFIRMLSIEIEYNEGDLQENPIQESSKLLKYVPQMAKIAAVAVLNCCSISDPLYKGVNELAKFFQEHLTAMRLLKLCQVIKQMMDKADFTSSIRLMLQVETTTKPRADRVE